MAATEGRAAAALLFVAAVMVAQGPLGASGATVHTVGDAKGWTALGKIDYKSWSASEDFQVGDTILFVYNPKFHDVMEVTHADYNACNASAPIHTYKTGNDSYTIQGAGHYYFLCGVPGHCEAGQRVDIRVSNSTADGPSSGPSASPSPSAASARGTKSPTGPTPSANAAAPLLALKGLFALLGFAMAVVAALASC
ncbi:mavicyanin [Malania oleifera]|uniref:mavicyanin n=1 Tax=Malania oleifera TaxID=397392 RepID=UPI0025ADCB95|nr:mavicyanin [Malania oleifera]